MTEQTELPGAQAEILIVEDSPVEAEMLRRVLVRAGYRVVLAKNGAEGLQAVRAHRPALVMSDINMPLMNGYDLCHAIKLDEKLYTTPVILVTSLSEPKDIVMALEVGADSYITKPYVEANLLGRIRSLLTNGHGEVATPDNETHHARSPHLNPLPQAGEEANESLREFYVSHARRKLAEERRKVSVEYDGERHIVAVGGQQMVNLLLSVYENSLTLNQELMHIQDQLNVLNENLEEKIRERTAALQESEAFKSSMIDSSNDCIKIIDQKGMLIYMSAGGQRLLEIKDINKYLGKSWVDFWDEDDRKTVQEAISKAKQGEIGKFQAYSPSESGTPKWWDVIITPIKDVNGAVNNLLAVSRDITERKQAESRLNEQLDELRRWHQATLGMGMRNIELKCEVNKLLGQAGQPPRYPSAEQSNAEG